MQMIITINIWVVINHIVDLRVGGSAELLKYTATKIISWHWQVFLYAYKPTALGLNRVTPMQGQNHIEALP